MNFLYRYSVKGSAIQIDIYTPSSPDKRLLEAPKAAMVSAISGYRVDKAPTEAVIILAEPTPDAIASEYGCKGVYAAKNEASNPIKIVPKTVPTIYTPKTPSPSGESSPYLSAIIAIFGSLAIE